ncbi:MAG: RNase adapter RapZ [Peptoniphilus sp.]|uniref:RNase adapter RapZ n=1 Tax=Peptoniphilus sp. TaxID=1971214 RepID=UPI002A74F9AE|nr:RNase adapter RapZ [Peptoniphilus sp.]MDY2987037.1 RNase adapter RapZ [Peptoniphilus sp.]
MEIFVITGMSGSGKSGALNVFEDLGYFAMDNLPPALVPKFAEMACKSDTMSKVCVVVDVRSGEFFEDFSKSLLELKAQNINYKLLFLDAREEVLVNRYKEKRRPHPLDKSILNGIRKEAKMLENIRGEAEYIIDTSDLSMKQFREKMLELVDLKIDEVLKISVTSFGFKNGILLDGDLIFDVRFLPNPYYIPELKNLSGENDKTKEFVLSHSVTGGFLTKCIDMLKFLIPNYIAEGKSVLSIGIGCTGGFHRSVVMTNEIGLKLKELGYSVEVNHRDLVE